MINGQRIKQARELRCLTQKELAKRVGVTQAAIAHVEGAFYSASEDLVGTIARKTELPLSFFSQDTPPGFPLGSLLFRAHGPLTRSERIETYRHAQLAYEILLFLSSQGGNRIPVRINVSSEDPGEAARQARKDLNLQPDEPVPHLLNILEHHGVLVLAMPPLKKREAFSLWHDGTPILAISDGPSGDRLRLTCAHELGHIVMHSKRLMFKINDSEADQFAAEFLLPAKAMRRELVPPITPALLAKLKPRWKVPAQALIDRAQQLELMTERQVRYLREQLPMIWAEEPIQLRPERPRLLRQMVEMLYGDPIDYRRLAADTNLTPEIVKNIVGCYDSKARTSQDEKPDLPMKRKVIKLQRNPSR